MTCPDTLFRLYLAVEKRRFRLARGLRYVEYFNGKRTLAEVDGDYVTDLHVVRSPRNLAVDGDLAGVAGFVGNGAPLDEPRNFKILIESHKNSPILIVAEKAIAENRLWLFSFYTFP